MSDIWIRKVRTYFRRHDFDEDGVISRKDFKNMAERFGDQEKIDPVQKQTARQRFSEIFSHYTKAAGKKDDVLLTEDLLIESIKMQKNDPAFMKAINDVLLSIFTAMDVNHDCHLDIEEYCRAFAYVGIVDANYQKQAFEAIDVNHDGKISFEEFIESFKGYLLSDDENTTAMFGLLP